MVIDADQAENLAEQALAGGSTEALTAALAAFTGELLPEDRYAPWAEARREELSAMCDRVRLALAEAHLADGETELATEVALRAVAAAPAEERAHRVLIDAYLRQGLRRSRPCASTTCAGRRSTPNSAYGPARRPSSCICWRWTRPRP